MDVYNFTTGTSADFSKILIPQLIRAMSDFPVIYNFEERMSHKILTIVKMLVTFLTEPKTVDLSSIP